MACPCALGRAAQQWERLCSDAFHQLSNGKEGASGLEQHAIPLRAGPGSQCPEWALVFLVPVLVLVVVVVLFLHSS